MSAGVALEVWGAADTVTGSRFLVTTPHSTTLVDCGLFQGLKVLRARNRVPFPVPPSTIDTVVLTHAHLDHSGYVPALVRDGYAGRVLCTPGTAALCGILLPDSGHLLEEEAATAGRGGWSRHAHPTPLYTVEDAERSLRHLQPIPFAGRHAVGDVELELTPAGHIVGAAHVTVRTRGVTVHFSGDLGRADDPLMRPPSPPSDADVIVVESTYGDRTHPPQDPAAQLADIVRRTVARRGAVLIPAFAVGRTESLLLHLSRLRASGAIPEVPVYVNSPMAVNATTIYRRHREEHRISDEEFEAMYDLARLVTSVEGSKALNQKDGPMVIISASGMITGGRILHHLKRFGPDPANTVVLAGYQAAGTRGAALASGAPTVRIHGRDVPIRAEVALLDSMSAHADADGLLAWLRSAPRPPRQVLVTHGEPSAADVLRARIEHELGWAARVPEHGERIDVEPR